MVRILLADDHDIVRHGLRDMIARHPGWEVCGEACNGREAIDMATALRPDVAVVDMVMPDLDGIAVTKEIRAASPATEVLVFTMHESEDLAAAVLSPREREVVRLLAEGLDRRAIAMHLGIGERTVKAHQEAAMLKTGAHSVADLVRYALRNGIVGS